MTVRTCAKMAVLILLVAPVHAGQWSDQFSAVGFDGRISDIQVVGSDIIVCGMLTANGSTATPAIAVWDGASWEALAPHPPFTDLSHTAYIDGMVVTNGVNHSWQPDGPYRWTGTQWEVMGSGLTGGYINRIECSTTYGGQAVVGGFFLPPVAFWDGADWVSNMPPGVDGVATAMVVYDGDLYVAGSIADWDLPGSEGLMRWDGVQWDLVSALDPATMTPQAGFFHTTSYGYTTSLAVLDGLLYIGGEFDLVGTMAASNIVALDAATGQWVQVDGLADTPNALAVYGGELYAGGPVGTIPGAAGPGSLGRLTGGGWVEAGASPNGTVDALAADTVLLVAGLFDAAGGVPAGNFTTWNGSSYADLVNPAGEGLNGPVVDLEPYSGTMLAAGDFTLAGALQVAGLAQWNAPGWSAFAGGGPDGAVAQLLVEGQDIYLVGEFTEVNGQPIAQVAHWDGAAWSGYAAALPSSPTCVATVGGDLYAGTTLYYVDDQSALRRGYLARWTGSDWDLIIADAVVHDLADFGGELWAAVDYFEFDGSYPNLVSYDGLALTGRLPSVSGAENLCVIGAELYILGDFGDMWTWNGVQLATARPSHWELPDPLSGLGPGRIYDVYKAGDRIYLGTQGNYNGYTVWEWNLGTDIAHPLDRGTNNRVYAICPLGDAWFFGGWFTIAGLTPALNFNPVGNPIPSRGLARWDPGVTAVDRPPFLADGYSLDNAPNPFNPSTTIRFELPVAVDDLRVRIYDARGRLVRAFNLGPRNAGAGTLVWDGKNRRGETVASGVYYCRLAADGQAISRPMTLMK